MIYAKQPNSGQGSLQFPAHPFAVLKCGMPSSTARDAALPIVHTISSSFLGRDGQFYAARNGLLILDGRKHAVGTLSTITARP